MKINKSKSFFFFLIVYGVLVICILVGGYFYYKNLEKRYSFEIQNQLTSIATLKIEELVEWKKERIGDASVFVSNKIISDLIKSYFNLNYNQLKSKISILLSQTKRAYSYDRVALYDKDCKELVHALGDDTNAVREIKEVVETARNKNEIQIIDFYKENKTNRKYLWVYTPIIDEDKEAVLLGFVLFRIDPETYFYPFINRWPAFNKTAETLIIRQEKDSVLFLNNVRHLPNTALNLKVPISRTDIPSVKAVSGQTGIVYGNDYRGVPVMAYISPVPGYSWFMVAKIDISEIYDRLFETIEILILLISSLIVGSGISLRYLWRRQRIIYYREKYESEKELRQKQELYKTLINTLPERILFKATDSTYVSCNNAFSSNANIDPEQIAGKTDFDFHSVEAAKRFLEEDRMLSVNQQTLVSEEEHEENGEKKVFIKIKTPVIDANGILVGILCIAEDITKRKQNEIELAKSLEQLKTNKERLETAQSIAHVASWEYDVVANKIWGSPEGFRIYGLIPEDSGELPIDEIEKCIPEHDLVHRALIDLLQNGKEYNLEFDVIPANGLPPRRIISVAEVIKNSEGEAIRVSGFIQDVTEQKRAEQAIRESKNLFETVVNTSPALIWMSGLDKGCSWFNVVWLKFTGRTMEQEFGNGWAEGVYPDDFNRCLDVYVSSFDKHETFEMEYRLRRYDGQYRWILDKGQPRYDAGNCFSGYIGSCIDISDRKNIEALLIESEEKYRLLAETAKDIIMIQDLDGGIIYLNKAGQNLFGFTEEDYYTKSVGYFIPKKYDSMLKGFLNSRKEGFEHGRVYEIEFVDKRGIFVPMEVISAPIIKDGKITSILSISRDITDRKKAETELKILNAELEARIKIRTAELEKLNFKLQQQIEETIHIEQAATKYANEVSDLYNNSPCGYHSLNNEGFFVRINDTELKWLGYHGSEIINKLKFIDVITDESKEKFKKYFPIFKNQGYISEIEFDVVRKDGSVFSVVASATAIKDENGELIMSRSTLFDISEIKHARREIELLNKELLKRATDLESINKELEAFAYSVSHDLRSPLRTIDGFSKIVIEDYSGKLDSEGIRLLGIIRSSAQKMDKLIIDLLSLSKVTRTELKLLHIDMTALVRALYYELTTEEERNQIKFKLDPLIDTNGDPILMRQVWENLLSNAIKYTKTKPERIIEIGSYLENGKVVYFVKDNGVGFNPEYSHKLFGVFQRLHSSGEFEGTGVGLAIVSRIILRHGGKVWAEGTVNNGACFYFELPQIKTS